jgi:hypothetical protein
MNHCIQPSAVTELAATTLSRFDKAVSAFPDALGAEFFAEARTLQAELLVIYRLVAISVRGEDDLDKVAELWALMVNICDQFARRLGELNQARPESGAGIFYDQILDLRNKCRRLEELHA